jgi:hypothetical protein
LRKNNSYAGTLPRIPDKRKERIKDLREMERIKYPSFCYFELCEFNRRTLNLKLQNLLLEVVGKL